MARHAVTVLVCRGCCCGTAKHPEVDHARQLAALAVAVAELDHGRLRVTDCLGPCDRSNVVAVRHHDTERPGARLGTTWLGGVLGEDRTTALCNWLRLGAPRAALPANLEASRFEVRPAALTPDREIRVIACPLGV